MSELFDSVASNYETVGPKYFSYFGRVLVDAMALQNAKSVLDVACGRGASIIPVLETLSCEGRVVGVDLSSEMLKALENEIKSYNNFELYQMNAETMSFEDETFDTVVCGLAFGFFSDRPAALKEFYRVLRQSGTVGITTWKEREEGVIGYALNQLKPSNRKRKGINIGRKQDMITLMKEAGFSDIQVTVEKKTFYYTSKEEWWAEQHNNATYGLMARLKEEGLYNQFKEIAFKKIEDTMDEHGIRFDAEVLITTGRKLS